MLLIVQIMRRTWAEKRKPDQETIPWFGFLYYEPEEEQEFAVRWIHTGKYEATYLASARNLEEAHAYVATHRQELEPVDVVPLSDDYKQFL